jgi:hypothetical protein
MTDKTGWATRTIVGYRVDPPEPGLVQYHFEPEDGMNAIAQTTTYRTPLVVLLSDGAELVYELKNPEALSYRAPDRAK